MNPVIRKIDFSSSVPYYAQLKSLIKDEITEGVWRNEDQLPSHSEICEMYDVSKSVVRQALRDLELEGYIMQRRGKLTEIIDQENHRGHPPKTFRHLPEHDPPWVLSHNQNSFK